jgi:hypothetical protein
MPAALECKTELCVWGLPLMSLSAISNSLSTKFRHSDTEIPTTLCTVPRTGPSPTHLYALQNQNYPLSVTISCRLVTTTVCRASNRVIFVHFCVLQKRPSCVSVSTLLASSPHEYDTPNSAWSVCTVPHSEPVLKQQSVQLWCLAFAMNKSRNSVTA